MSIDISVSHVSAKIEPSDFTKESEKLETWIVIQTLGNPFLVKINQNTTVYDVKRQICRHELIPVAELNIMTIQSTLADSAIVWDYKDSKLFCVLRIKKASNFISSKNSIDTKGLVQITA